MITQNGMQLGMQQVSCSMVSDDIPAALSINHRKRRVVHLGLAAGNFTDMYHHSGCRFTAILYLHFPPQTIFRMDQSDVRYLAARFYICLLYTSDAAEE